VILVDANLLLHAVDATSEHHAPAKRWWDTTLSGPEPVCLCWTVLNAFLRISTNSRVYDRPLSTKEALDYVRQWLGRPNVRIVHATSNHFERFSELMKIAKVSGNLVTDTHLAALALEHGCTLCSTDADFSRFKGLRWVNPLGED
jgi:toxin-antitoxin system PIN domain toxin